MWSTGKGAKRFEQWDRMEREKEDEREGKRSREN